MAEAADGAQAVDAVRACRPDVAILDLQMPAMTGLQAASTIARELPEVGILVLTVAGVLFAVLKSSNAHDNQVSTLPYVAAVAVIAGAAMFAWLVPARVARAGTGLVLARRSSRWSRW